MLPAKTPDVTPAQITAIITAVVGLVVAFGFVDNDRAQAIIGAASTIVPAVWVLADSILRHGRAQAVAHIAGLELKQVAEAAAKGETPAGVPKAE